MKKLEYPVARKGDQVDVYHGVTVADPYRYLENPQDGETREWVKAQNELTRSYLSDVSARGSIEKRLTSLWNYEKTGAPFKYGEKTFFYRNSGLQNQYVLYVVDEEGAEPRVLIDANAMSENGTVSLSGISLTDDGRLIAYGVSKSGSDWQEWRIRDVETGCDLEDHLRWIKFSSASWTPDGKGFFYSRYDEPRDDGKHEDANYFQKLYYHEVGTPQSADRLVYERPDEKEWGFGAGVTEDGKYLVISVWNGTAQTNRLFYKDLDDVNGSVVELLSDADAKYSFLGNEGSKFWLFTTLDAPRGRVVSIDVARFDGSPCFEEVIAECEDSAESVNIVGERFFVEYLHHACTRVVEYELDGRFIREVSLPGLGEASGFSGRRSDMELYYSYTSFTTPTTIYRYDIASGASVEYFRPAIDFDPTRYITKQVFVESKDGTQVPLFITYRKGLKRNGNNPTLLYGYGGFNISLTPGFSVGRIVWLEMGGIYAQACLRGGGEYGKEWHEAGTKLKKQNVFDDFISCAEWLIEEGYTSSKKLAISGGSNGGLLVGACMTQRPELFGAACPSVGVLDMLRFHKFTIGWAWVSDYGSSENPQEFEALLAYSPLHNLKEGVEYPATLVTTGDHDDRVVPAHSYKFTAALQAAHAGETPVLIRVETDAGHGAGKPTAKIIAELVDEWSFLVKVLEIPRRKLRGIGR